MSCRDPSSRPGRSCRPGRLRPDPHPWSSSFSPGRRCLRSHSGRRPRGFTPTHSRVVHVLGLVVGCPRMSSFPVAAGDVVVEVEGSGRSSLERSHHAVSRGQAECGKDRHHSKCLAHRNPPLQVHVDLPPWRTFSYQRRLVASFATKDSGSHVLDGVRRIVCSSGQNAIRRRARGISIWRS